MAFGDACFAAGFFAARFEAGPRAGACGEDASLGFLALFLWAVWHGMFRDIEKPKRTMLENEQMLDLAEQVLEGKA